jgi:HlyD family secretion protein
MAHGSVRRILPMLVPVALLVGGLIYLAAISGSASGPLETSGTVEGVEVSVASEIPGRVVEVLVAEGQAVQRGDPLFRLDEASIEVRRRKATALAAAAVTAARLQLVKAEQELDALLEDAPLVMAQAQSDLAAARDALDDAQRRRAYQQSGRRATDETIEGVEAQLALAEEAVDQADHTAANLSDLSSSDPKRAAAEAALYEARQQRDAIKTNLNWYTGEPTDIDQAMLDARVALAEAQVLQAQLEWEKWKDGPDPSALKLAQASVDNAKAQLEAAEATAAAELDTLDLDADKITVRAPVSGVVLTRLIEPGEVVAAGATVFTIGQLDALRITVYLPEDRYGGISLGEQAQVTVDTFPGDQFVAMVSRIADEAEFTPRNVQTEEGRRTMVFAVELSVVDPEQKLRPGMPASVAFDA